ncbi:MAG: DUF4040 domain-containing protein [Rickettsia endosymbiont of Bryobia graminum]|nr:DUF4040 domain-containing protein [Rickettsia endosymbiont of Bryobia graminum]
MIPEIINFQLSTCLLATTLILLCAVSIKLIFCNSLLSLTITSSVFSLLISLSYLLMDAPDVAMTEVALGSCLSTCVSLSFLNRLPKPQKYDLKHIRLMSSSIICLIFILLLSYTDFNLPEYGSADSPLQEHLTKYYTENTQKDIGIPSFVAALLASYRGYDTLGETIVILIAGISVLLLFSKTLKKNSNA